jgi:hypothetical protein
MTNKNKGKNCSQRKLNKLFSFACSQLTKITSFRGHMNEQYIIGFPLIERTAMNTDVWIMVTVCRNSKTIFATITEPSLEPKDI